jgi:hypothetical protein
MPPLPKQPERFPLKFFAGAALLGSFLAGVAGCASDPGGLTAVRPVALTHDDFALADANRDGKLSRFEADNYLAFIVFTASDNNADGRLTQAEWIHEDPAQLAAFGRCDANGDGLVTLSEAIAYSHRDRAAIALIRQADRNRDGKLNRAEIDAYFLRVAGFGG